MGYPTIKSGSKEVKSIDQHIGIGEFKYVTWDPGHDNTLMLACGAENYVILYEKNESPFLEDVCNVTVVKDAKVEIKAE